MTELLALLLLWPSLAWGQTAVFPLNKTVTSPANQPAVIVLTPLQSSQNIRIYDLSVRCSAGSATLTIADGGTTIRTYTNVASPSQRIGTFIGVPLIGTKGLAMTLTLSTCGSGNTGTLSVRADSY